MLTASGSLLTGAAAGAAVVAQGSEPARAAQTDFTVEGDDVTIQQGSIAALTLSLNVGWGYELPSGKSPARVEVSALAGPSESELTQVASATSDATFLQESGEEAFEADVLQADGLSADTLRPPEGETAQTTVAVGSELQVFSESDTLLAAASRVATATVSVTVPSYDASEYGALSGAGTLTVEVE